MSLHTTLGVGGKADLFYTTKTSADLIKAVRLARSFKVPVTVIGEGSGVVVSDSGLEGLVIKSSSERVQIRPHRSFVDLFRKTEVKKMEVTIDGGVGTGLALKILAEKGIVGLEEYGNYAGSVAGVVKDEVKKELVKNVSVVDSHGGVKSIPLEKVSKEDIILDATFLLETGEVKKGLIDRKKTRKKQITKVFENLAKEEVEILGYPTKDPGYLIGEILNLKGYTLGRMKVSDDDQNTIENLGGGAAEDYVNLVEEIKERSRAAVGIDLTEKVKRLGRF